MAASWNVFGMTIWIFKTLLLLGGTGCWDSVNPKDCKPAMTGIRNGQDCDHQNSTSFDLEHFYLVPNESQISIDTGCWQGVEP